MNLIGNAIKFTRNGYVIVEITESFPEKLINFKITDTGIGIHKDIIKKLGAEFTTYN